MLQESRSFSQVLIFLDSHTLNQSLASYLAALNRQLKASANYQILSDESQLLERLDQTSLIVIQGHNSELEAKLYQAGAAFVLPLDRFLPFALQFFELPKAVATKKILLAFLESHIAHIASAMFGLYGYDTEIIESEQQLQKEVRRGNFHLILNQDLNPSIKSQVGVRERIFRSLLDLRYKDNDFTLTIVKDFSQGSLFEDINSSVRKLANIMLSPDELLFFFRNYLWREQLVVLQEKYSMSLESTEPQYFQSQKAKSSTPMTLKNMKTAYRLILAETEKQHRYKQQSFLDQTAKLQCRHAATEWLEKQLQLSEDIQSRASFEFVDEYPGSEDHGTPNLVKVLPFQPALESPVRRSHS